MYGIVRRTAILNFWCQISYIIVNYIYFLLNKWKKFVHCNSELKTDLQSLGSGGFLQRNFWRIWTKGTLAHYILSST
jgi:hypothetical protein